MLKILRDKNNKYLKQFVLSPIWETFGRPVVVKGLVYLGEFEKKSWKSWTYSSEKLFPTGEKIGQE
jgi:hypothetical protein